ncbi:hypothetical protein [Streptomyces sp. NPDC088183]|uniref:hypothetical protein n=1 Tax=Streptomyces sp. NPDC088183 TaxID=3160992 RepID=UPI0034466CCE
MGGVLIGADDVAAAQNAVVQAGGVLGTAAVAERLGAFVMAEQECLGIIEDHGVFVVQQAAGGGGGDDGAREAWALGGGLDGVPCSGAGDPSTAFEVVVEVGDGVGDCADGLHVDELVNVAPAAGCVSLRDQGCAQVTVLDGERNEAAWPAGDVPGERSAESLSANTSMEVGPDDVA